jgi:type II secretory pathway pseudopilin PulG
MQTRPSHRHQIKAKKKNQTGVSLLEFILALVIIGLIAYASMAQYFSFRRSQDLLQVRRNVDYIFFGLAEYYRANCNNSSNTLYSYYNSVYYPVTVTTLDNAGYTNTAQMILNNPYVSVANPASNSYITQFNQIQTSGNLPSHTLSAYSGTVTNGYVVAWTAQVSVKLNSSYEAKSLLYALGADCLSTDSSVSGAVLPCRLAPANATKYAVWERPPTYSSLFGNSKMWQIRPATTLFSNMYTIDPITATTDSQSLVSSNYFRCGG